MSLATDEREVRPVEQHIHSFLEVLPLAAMAFTGCLHSDQVRATLRGGVEPDDWKLLPKENPFRSSTWPASVSPSAPASLSPMPKR